MYTGGYVNEFTVILAGENGDLGEVKWTQMLFWILMVLLAFGSVKAQLDDRKTHLEAYKYKSHDSARYENYRSMRERITRLGGANKD